MKRTNKTKTSAWDFLWYALYAFAGLGMEFVLLSVIEPLLFQNADSSAYTAGQSILHWLLTCLFWGGITFALIHFADGRLGFRVLSRERPTQKGVLLSVALVALCILLNALDWGTLKVAGEFAKKGPLLFGFQYLYYIFEVALVFLIVAFGQKFGERLLGRKSNVPFGGLVLCFTWGAIHTLSQGSLATGLGVMVFALLYGCIYLLLSRNARYSYLAMALAFMI